MKIKRKKIILVAGARPNFMKIAPLIKEFSKHKNRFELILVHTGQHYDFQMSEVFLKDLDIPKPDIYLGVGSGSHAEQTAKIMIKFENVLLKENPQLIIVVGDVNSTLACSLVSSKLNVKVAHVEAGLRSFDRTMPEEINRMVTDSLSDYLFVSEESGIENLKKESVDKKKIFFVGNTMIDTLLTYLPNINKSNVLRHLKIDSNDYAVLTLHRPSNVDSKDSLAQIYAILKPITTNIKIIYPVHPRSKQSMKNYGFLENFQRLSNLVMVEPFGYIDFIKLVKESKFVLTDSGGIQEETTILNVPCLTMRENTERPITISVGTNQLVGRNKKRILACAKLILNGKEKKGSIPRFWDGNTSQRIIKILLR